MSTSRTPKCKARPTSNEHHIRVAHLPRFPGTGESYWLDSPNGRHDLTHQLFRFPAKFHPPVVRWALDAYGRGATVLLDPFVGSGTALVEGLLRGIPSVGIDIDPLACLVSSAKASPIDPRRLREGKERIFASFGSLANAHSIQERRPDSDIGQTRFEKELKNLNCPPIPNITHWFRRYVIVDLARLFAAIQNAELGPSRRRFFEACAAAIIRRVSNADPDPVSGLEVTSIQKKRNSTRTIRVFEEYSLKVDQAIQGMSAFWEAYRAGGSGAKASLLEGDALHMARLLQSHRLASGGVSLVITSPPYCRSVDYSRRHKLEMYWLGLVRDPQEHIQLTHKFIGRRLVRVSDWGGSGKTGVGQVDDLVERIERRDVNNARTTRHYFWSIDQWLSQLQEVLTRRGKAVIVLGNSVCCGVPIATSDIVAEMGAERFKLIRRFSYALRNHYMQYGLWNGDGIKEDHVLVFERR